MLVLEKDVQGISEGFSRARALLAKPERMFKTDEYDQTCDDDKKQKITERKIFVIEPIKAYKDGVYENQNQ